MSYLSFSRFSFFGALFLFALSFTSCLKEPDFGIDNPNQPEKARARIEITDAPIDDPNVRGVFVTIADVKINGKSWAGFSGAATFDLLALQQGATRLLGEGELEAGVYDDIVLVLQTDADANGNSPGCYVLDGQGMKHAISGSNSLSIRTNGMIATTIGATTSAVIDFDLRRSVVNQQDSNMEYQFVTEAELAGALRIMEKESTGSISGHVSDGVSGSEKIIVYAYEKGDFETDEKFPQGPSSILFKNAVSSAAVQSDGSFKLAFMETGNYELHFISYTQNAQGQLQARGELQMNVLGTVLSDLLDVQVGAGDTTLIDLKVSALLFF
ncbi:MAG: DUF4382 domain-containing protein [Saprospiraceae bacterium]|nr:DUF4382 domain-containing protein [Saprospiraceae bacterium]